MQKFRTAEVVELARQIAVIGDHAVPVLQAVGQQGFVGIEPVHALVNIARQAQLTQANRVQATGTHPGEDLGEEVAVVGLVVMVVDQRVEAQADGPALFLQGGESFYTPSDGSRAYFESGGTIRPPTEGTIRHIKVPVAFSKTPGGYYRHPETLGQSTASVLEEVGYSADDIAALQTSGATIKADD